MRRDYVKEIFPTEPIVIWIWQGEPAPGMQQTVTLCVQFALDTDAWFFLNYRHREWMSVLTCIRTAAALIISLLLADGATTVRADTAPPDSALLARYRPPPIIPTADAPDQRDKIALGKQLFFDPILSGSSSRSCATCHDPALSWGDGKARSINDNNSAMKLRAPTLIDIYQLSRLGWDGKFRDIEAVTFAAITSAGNMDLPEHEALARLARTPDYVVAFNTIFPNEGLTRSTVEQAIAAFERTIVSGPAPFDRWVAGQTDAISESAQRGFALFNGKANCAACHSGWAFTDGSFHDIGTAKGDDIGRGALFPTSRKLRYAFKTPTLRDVAHRAPYMHDGSVPDLAAVISLYNEGGIDRPSRSELIHPLGLSTRDQIDLISFLYTLTETSSADRQPALPH
jgi:cytochrome c peroxidase